MDSRAPKCVPPTVCEVCAEAHRTPKHTCTSCKGGAKCPYPPMKCANCPLQAIRPTILQAQLRQRCKPTQTRSWTTPCSSPPSCRNDEPRLGASVDVIFLFLLGISNPAIHQIFHVIPPSSRSNSASQTKTYQSTCQGTLGFSFSNNPPAPTAISKWRKWLHAQPNKLPHTEETLDLSLQADDLKPLPHSSPEHVDNTPEFQQTLLPLLTRRQSRKHCSIYHPMPFRNRRSGSHPSSTGTCNGATCLPPSPLIPTTLPHTSGRNCFHLCHSFPVPAAAICLLRPRINPRRRLPHQTRQD